MKKEISLLFFLFLASISYGQASGIGTAAPHVSAALEIASTTRGLLVPRTTSSQRDAIPSQVPGLLIYNLTTNKLQVRTSTGWVDVQYY